MRGIINRAYVRDFPRCFGPVFFAGETYTFYMNLSKPTSDPGFATFQLNLRELGETGATFVATDIGPLQQDFVNGLFYNIYSQYVMPDVPFGWYELVIYDTAGTGLIKAVSNMIQVEERDRVRNVARVTWRNKHNIYGINYEGLPNFYNSLTVPIIQTTFQVDQDKKQYRNVSNRRLRNYLSYDDPVYDIESYYFDEEGHKAMVAVYNHDEIYLDYTFIVPKDAYKIEDRQTYDLSKAKISVYADDSKRNPVGHFIIVPPPPHGSPGPSVYDLSEYSDEYE